ncbi:mannitol-1-phosphate 5-dehydrogenase [Buchnera aphidicola]|uniref:mannitol-1-phosphate 5-dehydrogenase n=1 Tax=Buchnera aphidicola TaxID=9 RepID=UPI0034640F63
MQSLHFGAGNIGRGLIGKLLSESGFNVIFADVNLELVDAINYYKQYNIRIVDKYKDEIQCVKKISAIHVENPDIYKIIANTNLITTAVGFNILEKISMIITQGIIYKINTSSQMPLNIIACENKALSSSYLKKMILSNIPIEYHAYIQKYIGFVDCSIDSIIPSVQHKEKDILFLMAENFQEWIVNPNQFKGKIPDIINMKFSNNLIAYIERKLFTLNTGHAIAAYLGLLKKYKTIKEAISDHDIRNIVKSAMQESGNVLINRYHFNKNDHLSYINTIFCRFENAFLIDSLERIGRNPLQKLEKQERLIKPLLGAIEYNLPYKNLIKGIASVFHYHNKNDRESMKINFLIKKDGIQKTILNICQLKQYSYVVDSILTEYQYFFS